MSKSGKFCLVGQVLVDVTLSSHRGENKLRLGGIMHAARAMWALGVRYSLAYLAPSYLMPLVDEFARGHEAEECVCIGEIVGSPNVILIPEPTEAGSQGYELLLRDTQRSRILEEKLKSAVRNHQITDAIVFPGGFDLSVALKGLSDTPARCHIDLAYDVLDLNDCRVLGREFEVVMLSTSSNLFLANYGADPIKVRDAVFSGIGTRLLFKENRGGARLFVKVGDSMEVGAQLRSIEHSVGVGDCFDAVFAALRCRHTDQVALSYASHIAADYASTTFPDDLKTAVTRTLKIEPANITQIEGVRVPWEARGEIHVYIAAPDFDYVDRGPIEAVTDALQYHNFRARRPVIEHGQVKERTTRSEKVRMFHEDMELLNRCNILLAVLVHNDPGTLVEIGLAKQQGKPVIVYDPHSIVENLILEQAPDVLARTLNEAIAGVFEHSARILRNER